MPKSRSPRLMQAPGGSKSLPIGHDSVQLTPAAETRNHSLIVMMSRAAAWKCEVLTTVSRMAGPRRMGAERSRSTQGQAPPDTAKPPSPPVFAASTLFPVALATACLG